MSRIERIAERTFEEMTPEERGKQVQIAYRPAHRYYPKSVHMLFGIPSCRSGGCWIRLTEEEIKLLPVEWQEKWRQAKAKGLNHGMD